MRNFFERINQNLKSNKGFSLVELIIVIAIMAVLIAVLAPQYTKYVERSREAVDNDSAASILQAVKIAVIDPENGVTGGGTVSVADGGTVTSALAPADANAKVESALEAVLGDVDFKSKAHDEKAYTVTVSWDATNKVYKFSDGAANS